MNKYSSNAKRAFYLSTSAFAMSLVATAHAQQALGKLRTPITAAISHSRLVGKAIPSQILHLTVSLLPPNKPALESFAKSVCDPKSPLYGQFLTPAQFGARFGQTTAMVNKVVGYLKSEGMTVTLVAHNNLSIRADATVSQSESAFHTRILNYVSLDANDLGRNRYYSFSTALSMPAGIATAVGSVSGLTNQVKPIPRLKRFRRQSASTPLTPVQTSHLYDTLALHNSNHWGQERTVGISSFDGFDPNNVGLFYNMYNLPVPSVGAVKNVTNNIETIDGGSESAAAEGEGDLDIQMVLSQAPLCKLIVYDGGGDLIPVLTQEAEDNKADIITESYGWDYDTTQADSAHTLHLQLTAQGTTYFLASGDYGTTFNSSTGTYADYDTEVTNVGGTVANTTAAGDRISEVGWSGSAGGWIPGFPVAFNTLPSWQKGTGVPTNINYRLIPDVALHSAGSNDPNNDPGAYEFFYQGSLITENGPGFSGTSFASPVFAGSFADVEQQLIDKGVLKAGLGGLARFGRINDLIYAENGNSNIWYDIQSGSNGTLPNGTTAKAGKGWDFVTGWGAVDFNDWANSFSIPAPTVIDPTSATVYNGFGQNPTGGVSNLSASDGSYYAITSVPTVIGPLASPKIVFAEPLKPATLSSLSLTLVENAPTSVKAEVYLYNYSTNLWNLMSTTAMTGSDVKIVVNPWNFNQFVSSAGAYTVVVRAVSSGSAAFTLDTDEAVLTATPQAP
jgi:subtilase family serine protease